MKSFLRLVVLVPAFFLTPLSSPVHAATASCLDWPVVCSDDGRFLIGEAEIEGRIDATAIGMSSDERFRLSFRSTGATNGEVYSESAFAELDMDRSSNTVPIYGEHEYDGGTTNAEHLPEPDAGDRFGGGVSLVPSLSWPGDIIGDHSLAMIDLDVRAPSGVLWPKDGPSAPVSAISQFRLDLGFYGLEIDPYDPEYYDLDRSRFVTLTATGFDVFRFTYSDVDGSTATRELSMGGLGTELAAMPLPGPVLFLLTAMAGLVTLRRRQRAKAII